MRKIIHCDCDCFFVAVEARDNPALKGLPIAVGGSTNRRGVISTCSYEARKFGVHSAMATATALRLCPQLILLPHRFDAYKEASLAIRRIFLDYTDIIEPLSFDEAFLDITNSQKPAAIALKGSATLIAQEIRQRIEQEVGITASAGIAPNKFLAKVGSDWNKPNGQFVLTPDEVDDFVNTLPVRKIFGVGKVTGKKLKNLGVETCGDLQAYSLEALSERFGKFGRRLYELARGIDDRPVKVSRVRKSMSVEHTYPTDLASLQECKNALPKLLDELHERLKKRPKETEIGTPVLKMKFTDFTRTTVEQAGSRLSLQTLEALCEQAYERKKIPVRLLGVGVKLNYADKDDMDKKKTLSNQSPASRAKRKSKNSRQLDLFDKA